MTRALIVEYAIRAIVLLIAIETVYAAWRSIRR